MSKHTAKVEIVRYVEVLGISAPFPVFADSCSECGRPVRRMTGLGGPGRRVFWHASPKPGPDDPRRAKPRPEAWVAAISRGMIAANERRARAKRPVR